MSTLTHAEFKERILAPEREDAAAKQANPGYWGDTGLWVQIAISYAEAAIDRVPVDQAEVSRAWLRQVLAALQAAVSRFRDREDDPDGYGIATLHGCVRRVQEWLD